MSELVIDLNEQIFNPKDYECGTRTVGRREIPCKKVFIRDMKIVNLMLHDMVNIQNNDNGMRNCLSSFNKAPSRKVIEKFKLLESVVDHVTAIEKIEIKDEARLKSKRYSLICKNGEFVMGVDGSNKSDRVQTRTREFGINHVDEGIRNRVMGWFE